VLKGNHVHLLIETKDAPLSKVLQGVNRSYTLYLEAKMVALFAGDKNAEIFLEVGWFFEDLLLLGPPGDNVINGVVVFYPGLLPELLV
jgi:hypothetical protein